MKLMLSQPMNGKTEKEIREEREQTIKDLEKRGHSVIDTIFTEKPPENSDAGLWYLAKSIEAMSKVDGIVLMKGWENARGCRVEHYIASQYGKLMYGYYNFTGDESWEEK